MFTKHIAIINAYELKDGGFRGVILNRETRERRTSDVLESLSAARFWAQSEAHREYSKVAGFAIAPMRRKNEYLANVWIAV